MVFRTLRSLVDINLLLILVLTFDGVIPVTHKSHTVNFSREGSHNHNSHKAEDDDLRQEGKENYLDLETRTMHQMLPCNVTHAGGTKRLEMEFTSSVVENGMEISLFLHLIIPSLSSFFNKRSRQLIYSRNCY